MDIYEYKEVFFLQLLIFGVILFVLLRFVCFIKNKQKSFANYILAAAMVSTLIGIIIDSLAFFTQDQIQFVVSSLSALFLLIILCLLSFFVYLSANKKDAFSLKLFLLITLLPGIAMIFLNVIYVFVPDLLNVYKFDSQAKNLTLTIIVLLCLLVLNIAVISLAKKHIPNRIYFIWNFYYISISIAVVVGAETGYCLYYLITFIAIILFYNFVIDNYDLLNSKKQELLLKNHTSAIIDQMQPEFLFNCLTAIINDSKEKHTKNSITNFSEFLRYNISAITGEEIVYYKDELQHLRTYVALENDRLDNGICIKYNLKTLDFKVPKYVLQPLIRAIIQNVSLKRSINSSHTFEITISTRKTKSGVTTIIECENVANIELTKEWKDISNIMLKIYNTNITKKLTDVGKKMILSAHFFDIDESVINNTIEANSGLSS